MSTHDSPFPEAQPPLEIPQAPPPRDPVWSGWDVVMILAVAVLGIFVFGTLISVALLITGHGVSEGSPAVVRVMLLAQFLSYIVVLLFMHVLVVRHYHRRFAEAVHWHWPCEHRWLAYLLGGMALAVVVQLSSFLLPIPKTLPIDKYFQSRSAAYIMSFFGVSMAPLVEELFFRGFLFPAGVRWAAWILSTPSLSRLCVVGSLVTLCLGALGYAVHIRWLWVIILFFCASLVLHVAARAFGVLREGSQPVFVPAIVAATLSVVGSLVILVVGSLGYAVHPVWQRVVVLFLFAPSLILYSGRRAPRLLREEFGLVFVPASIAAIWFLLSRIALQSLFWPVSALVFAFVLVNLRGISRPPTNRRSLTTGLAFAVAATALGFALVHASQLASAWAPLLVLFIVGLVFTVVRVVTRNVAPGFLMHVGYNFMLFAMLYIATDHFRHMERMLQQ